MAVTADQWQDVAEDLGLSVEALQAKITELDEARARTPGAGVRFWDRQLEPLTLGQWAYLTESYRYRVVESHVLPPTGVWVATIWEGVALRMFETTVFSRPQRPWQVLARETYETEREALDGHKGFVAQYSLLGERT